MTNLIKDRLKEITEVRKSIKMSDLKYSSRKKNYNISNCSSPTVFLRDIFERTLSINDTNEEENMFYNEITRVKHGRIPDDKRNHF